MDSAPGFPEPILALLAGEKEVEVETSRRQGGPKRTATIWIVVDERDRPLIRSWLGADARWYRDARANPWGAILAAGRRIPVEFLPAADDDRTEACSRGLQQKYSRSRSLLSMLRDEILHTTLELRPARG